MKKLCTHKIGFILLLSLFTTVSAQEIPKTETKYFGTIAEKLIPDTRELYYQLFQPFNASTNNKLAPPSEKGANVSAGFIFDPRNPENRQQIFIVEPQKETPLVCFDTNADGKIDKKECQTMTEVNGNSAAFEKTIELPLGKTSFKFYPVYIRLRRDMMSPDMKKGGRIIQ